MERTRQLSGIHSVKEEILKLRIAERKISEAMTVTMDSHARARLIEARSAVINVRVALMKLGEVTPSLTHGNEGLR